VAPRVLGSRGACEAGQCRPWHSADKWDSCGPAARWAHSCERDFEMYLRVAARSFVVCTEIAPAPPMSPAYVLRPWSPVCPNIVRSQLCMWLCWCEPPRVPAYRRIARRGCTWACRRCRRDRTKKYKNDPRRSRVVRSSRTSAASSARRDVTIPHRIYYFAVADFFTRTPERRGPVVQWKDQPHHLNAIHTHNMKCPKSARQYGYHEQLVTSF
jgi:hypothetical protein